MITFSAVTKRFGDGTVALDGVSFQVAPGELVVLTGPSGSGKTTIMKLLIRELMPTDGQVHYKGEALANLSEKDIPHHRRKIGVVFQDYKLLPELNVWENIALPLSIMNKPQEEIESRVTDLLSLVGLADRALVFPKQLSGGEAQRVSLARALATGPSLIFADEPTGNLDTKTSLEILKLLQQINSFGTTVVIATHDVALLDKLENERQLHLEKGKLAHDSRPVEAHAPLQSQIKPIEIDDSPSTEKATAKKSAKKSKKKEEAPEKSGDAPEGSEELDLADEFEAVDVADTASSQKAGEQSPTKSWLPKVKISLPKVKLPKLPSKPKVKAEPKSAKKTKTKSKAKTDTVESMLEDSESQE